MAKTPSKFGFVECADLVSEQKYGAALRQFQQSVGKFLDSKSPPKRGEIARQLFQIGSALEETLKKAMGEDWDTHVPRAADDTMKTDDASADASLRRSRSAQTPA